MDECVRASEQPVRKKKRIVGQEQGGVYTTVDSAVEETGKFGVFLKKIFYYTCIMDQWY